MTDTTPNLTQEERAQLRQFVRLVYEMAQSRFIQRVKVQDHSIKSERLENGEFRITAPDYDWEDFRSFLTAFRQVALSRNEPVYLPRIRNIVGRHGSAELRTKLGELKTYVIPIIEGKLVGIRFGKETPGGEISFTSYQLLDALVNGVVFHVDSEHEPAASFMLSSEPWEYVWIILIDIIEPVLRACTWLVNVIRIEKYLDETDFPITRRTV